MKAKIISAVPVPFTTSGEIDFKVYETLLDAISPYVDSVLVAGTTGEFPALDDGERIALFAATAQVVGAGRTIAHLGHASLRQVLRVAEGSAGQGVNRFALLTPYYLPTDTHGTFEHFRAVVERFPGHPLYAYLFPDRTGYEVPVAELGAILELPGIVGAKLSGGAAGRITEYASVVRPGQELYSGDDSTLPKVMSLGGSGVISGVSSAFPRIFAELVEALASGDETRIAPIQANVKKIVALVGSPLSHLKAALAERTGDTWACRMSQPIVTADAAASIRELVRAHG
jgi:4-hydroxy-tetrahydrodipicolinate synthase